jgi:hypothetical protein
MAESSAGCPITQRGTSMKIDGGCHCGRIRFSAEVEAGTVAICHCVDCQSLSGSPYRAAIASRAESFHIEGEPAIYIKTAESGRRRAQAFCPNCGASLYAADPENPSTYSIRIGSIQQRHELGPPSRQIWCDSALSWTANIEGVPTARRQT